MLERNPMKRWSAKRCLNYIYKNFNFETNNNNENRHSVKENDNDDDIYDENSNIISKKMNKDFQF